MPAARQCEVQPDGKTYRLRSEAYRPTRKKPMNSALPIAVPTRNDRQKKGGSLRGRPSHFPIRKGSEIYYMPEFGP